MTGPRSRSENEVEDKAESAEFFRPIVRGGEQFSPTYKFTYLMHGTTYHGRNYVYTKDDQKTGAIKDVTRLATTYYHRYGRSASSSSSSTGSRASKTPSTPTSACPRA